MNYRILSLLNVVCLTVALLSAACTTGNMASAVITTQQPVTETPAEAYPVVEATTVLGPTTESTTLSGSTTTEPATVVSAAELSSVALSARQALAQQLHIDLDNINLVTMNEAEWPSSCLGIEVAGEFCTQVVTSGFRVVLKAQNETYVLHTDKSGTLVRLAEAPKAEIGEPIITWSQTINGICESAVISQAGIVFRPCQAVMTEDTISENRAVDLVYFTTTFAPFEAETAAGTIHFIGQGPITATQAQQRMIAEWTRLVALEVGSERSHVPEGMLFTWHREGGIAGFCEDVTVYVTGDARVTSCRSNEPQDLGYIRLTSDQLQMVYNWMDTLKSFEFQRKDPAKADAMTIRTVFSGTGTIDPAESDIQAIQTLASDLVAQATAPVNEGNRETAQKAPVSFFEGLSDSEFDAAVDYYGGSYEVLSGYTPTIDSSNRAALFEAACTANGFVCQPVRNIVHTIPLSAIEFRFSVEFQTTEGDLFVLDPCCGADPEELPPQSQFDFLVRQENGTFLVQNLPV